MLAGLPSLRTRSTGNLVWPFVARLRTVPDPWRPREQEVAAVLDVSVDELADPATRGEQEMNFASWNARPRVPVRRIDGHLLWGLTLRILELVLPKVLAGEYPI